MTSVLERFGKPDTEIGVPGTKIRFGLDPIIGLIPGPDTRIGSIPILGDLFDVSWKSNQQNVALLERHMGVAPSNDRRSRALARAGVLVLILLGVAGAVATVSVLRWLAGVIHG